MCGQSVYFNARSQDLTGGLKGYAGIKKANSEKRKTSEKREHRGKEEKGNKKRVLHLKLGRKRDLRKRVAFLALPSRWAGSDKSLIRQLMTGIKDVTLTLG